MEVTPNSGPPPGFGMTLDLGMVGTVRHDDESWTRYLLTVEQCVGVLGREHENLPVISTRHPLGRILLGKTIGYEARYVDKYGKERRAWLEAIEKEPVREGKGSIWPQRQARFDLPTQPWEPSGAGDRS